MLSSYALDTFFAPELSKLTACDAPALPPRDDEWLSRFFSGTVFGPRVEAPHKLLTVGYLRKVEAALEDYETARNTLLAYLDGHRRTSMYFRALRQFENCLAMTYQTMLLVQMMAKAEGEKKGPRFYKSNDGSLPDRVDRLYNDSKHIDGAIVRGDFLHEHATVVIWLTNEGIRSKACVVTFQELHGLLLDLASWAEVLAVNKLPGEPGAAASS